jgi:catechol 2,3-dioxygenase-like lactoylglutathione lyase family enzyme
MLMAFDLIAAATTAKSLPTAPTLKGLHHAAFRCRDGEETRKFYEDILGLPLKAALVFEEEPGTGRPLPYMHLFFQMGDGNYVAFFDVPDGAHSGKFKMKWGMDLHFALEAKDYDEMMMFKARLDGAGVPCFGPLDHHFVHSIYFYDPNGINVEITCRDPKHDDIMASEAANAAHILAEWTARTAVQKAANSALTKSP